MYVTSFNYVVLNKIFCIECHGENAADRKKKDFRNTMLFVSLPFVTDIYTYYVHTTIFYN